MTAGKGAFIAVDGVNGVAVKLGARAAIATINRRRRGGISFWDASGMFEELTVAGDEAGLPSPRTLLLLYAADLAFRLRWEIRPILAEGRTIIAAPYVDTAVAFGRAAGLPGGWLADLFSFAPRPAVSRYIDAAPARSAAERAGFIEFGSERMAAQPHGPTRQQLVSRARAHFQVIARRRARRS